MPLARFAAAGVAAALLLLLLDLVWIHLFFPEAFASVRAMLAVLAELAPEAAGATWRWRPWPRTVLLRCRPTR